MMVMSLSPFLCLNVVILLPAHISVWQLVMSVYGPDVLGRDVVRGYGATRVPTIPGKRTRELALFVPESSSSLQQWVGYLLGQRPEFVDPKFIARGEGRDGASTLSRAAP
jgi:hypothetical protein